VIDASGFDTALDIPRELSAKNQILSAIALDERKNETISLKTSEATPTSARANCTMRSSCQSGSAFAGVGQRTSLGANYCGPQCSTAFNKVAQNSRTQ
jgi:hypothetical protein